MNNVISGMGAVAWAFMATEGLRAYGWTVESAFWALVVLYVVFYQLMMLLCHFSNSEASRKEKQRADYYEMMYGVVSRSGKCPTENS